MSSNLDTELYVIKRKEDGIQLELHISGSAYRVVDLNGNIQLFIEKQLESGKKLVGFLNENTKVFIKASDVENNMYKPLNEAQLITRVDEDHS